MIKHTRLILFALLLILIGCKVTEKDQIEKLVIQWQDKEVKFPASPIFTVYGKDTVYYPTDGTEYKILVFTDSIGCTSCKLKLYQWKEFMNQIDSLAPGKVTFLFYFHAKDDKEVSLLLRQDRFTLPVCLDRKNELDRLNKFPSNSTFQTFLLNSENQVLVLGNPIHNAAVKQLYLKKILGDSYQEQTSQKTQALVSKPTINLGRFSVEQTKQADFYLQNRGNVPLIIADAQTSCGCTKAEYAKAPVMPGDSVKITLEIKPKSVGYFHEQATLSGNFDERISCTITGNAY